MRRTACTPRAGPALRGRKRCVAHRPLPSMIIARCCGTVDESGIASVELACMTVRPGAVISGLNRHDFGVFLCHQLIDFGYVLVGEFLDFILGATFVVFGNFLFLRSEEHTSELQSLMRISYAVFCLKKKTQ